MPSQNASYASMAADLEAMEGLVEGLEAAVGSFPHESIGERVRAQVADMRTAQLRELRMALNHYSAALADPVGARRERDLGSIAGSFRVVNLYLRIKIALAYGGMPEEAKKALADRQAFDELAAGQDEYLGQLESELK